MTLPQPFPNLDVGEDYNPAIRLFGKRLILEQTIVELVTEFLAVVFSEKLIANQNIADPLPGRELLCNWPAGQQLKYLPQVKLNLKLFSFLGVGRTDGRHEVHKQHYQEIVALLLKKVHSNRGQEQNVIECLEEFLQGFQGAGFNRAWCAQTFYPISPGLLTQETIWNETIANNEIIENWNELTHYFHKFFSVSKHRFMARGGELIYLQLCNVFRTDESKIKELANMMELTNEEADIEQLYQDLQNKLPILKSPLMNGFDQLVDYIENIDTETHKRTNVRDNYLNCEWCPEESWAEGYLFAVEMKRMLCASLDPVERIELLMTGCALQVLRSVCAQSARYGKMSYGAQNVLGYAWIFSSTESSIQQRRLSQRNLQVIQGLIQKALKDEHLQENASLSTRNPKEKLYKEADNKYGHKLLLSLGKRLGIIAPYKGPGTRFVMTERVLRYLVVVLLRSGERVTYPEFLRRMYAHYGIAVEGQYLNDALRWSDLPVNNGLNSLQKGSWLADMLRAGGFLTDLSDAWSIVRNTFNTEEVV